MNLSRPLESPPDKGEPWQLQMFRRTLKKQQKLQAMLAILGDVHGQHCLLVTCGDNNGALNWHFKRHGGHWTWADAEQASITQIRDLTGDPVVAMDKEQPSLPLADDTFDVAVTIDVHEHLQRPERLNQELARLVKPGGRIIVTTPSSDEGKPANRVKRLLGMRAEDYGHVVVGYNVPELEQQLRAVGLQPYASGSYSRFFTEMVELLINFAYVKILSGRSRAKVASGQIAPQTEAQLKSVAKSYRLYSLIYPFMLALSKLDFLDRSSHGYAVIVAARRA